MQLTLFDQLPGQDQTQLDRIKKLEPGRLFCAFFQRGHSIVFPSVKHPGYWHVYHYLLAFSTMQQTERPISPEGVLMFLSMEGLSLDDFEDIEATHNELPLPKPSRGQVPPAPVRDVGQLLKGSA